jgi:AcrR family transcriptional regulator
MDAARDLLLELGDQDKLSVRAVTARAGVTPNALYSHFASKDELLSAVIVASYRELHAFLHAAAPSSKDPVEQLNALCHAYLDFAAQRPGIYRVLFMTKLPDEVRVAARVAADLDKNVGTFDELHLAVTRCLPKKSDPFRQATYIWAGLHGFASLNQVVPAFPWPTANDYVDQMIQSHANPLRAKRPNR